MSMTPRQSAHLSSRRSIPVDKEILDCLARGWEPQEIADDVGRDHQYFYIQLDRLKKRVHAKTLIQAVVGYVQGKYQFDERGYVKTS
jgi:hypothetical protein